MTSATLHQPARVPTPIQPSAERVRLANRRVYNSVNPEQYDQNESIFSAAMRGMEDNATALLSLVPMVTGVFCIAACLVPMPASRTLNFGGLAFTVILSAIFFFFAAVGGMKDAVLGISIYGRMFLMLYLFYWGIYYLQSAHYLQRKGAKTSEPAVS